MVQSGIILVVICVFVTGVRCVVLMVEIGIIPDSRCPHTVLGRSGRKLTLRLDREAWPIPYGLCSMVIQGMEI